MAEEIPDSLLMFDGDLRNRLARGKYTNWAKDLTEEQLIAVLWSIGEYGCRSLPVLNCLTRHQGEFFPADGYPRARLALELLSAMSDRHMFTIEQVMERIQTVLRVWRAELNTSCSEHHD